MFTELTKKTSKEVNKVEEVNTDDDMYNLGYRCKGTFLDYILNKANITNDATTKKVWEKLELEKNVYFRKWLWINESKDHMVLTYDLGNCHCSFHKEVTKKEIKEMTTKMKQVAKGLS